MLKAKRLFGDYSLSKPNPQSDFILETQIMLLSISLIFMPSIKSA